MPSSVTPKQLTRLSWPARTPGKEKATKVNIHRMSRTSAVTLLSQVSLQIHLKRCNARSNHPFSLPWRTIYITTAISKNSTMRFLKTRTHTIASIFLSALTTSSFCPEDLLIPNQALYWVFLHPRFQQCCPQFQPSSTSKIKCDVFWQCPGYRNCLEFPMFCKPYGLEIPHVLCQATVRAALYPASSRFVSAFLLPILALVCSPKVC